MEAVIVGAGASGLLHALALRAARVKIAAVYDPDASRASALAEACGAGTLSSFDEAVSADAAIAAVCSPPSLHVAQAERLASAGRTILVEKPVATSPGELDRLAALGSCVPIMQWRAGRALRALRRAVAHGELGSAPVVSCDLAWARDAAYFASRNASCSEGWGCGALLSIGIHAIDALAWALGRPVEGVSGMTSRRDEADAPGAVAERGETAAVGLMRFAGGAMASLRISLDGGADATRIAFCGRGVSAYLGGDETDPTARALVWSALDPVAKRRLEMLERDTPGALGPPLLVPYVGAVIDALRDGARPGDCDRLPSIEGTYAAHAAAMCIARGSA
jgi:predicted dehydrogenase